MTTKKTQVFSLALSLARSTKTWHLCWQHKAIYSQTSILWMSPAKGPDQTQHCSGCEMQEDDRAQVQPIWLPHYTCANLR